MSISELLAMSREELWCYLSKDLHHRIDMLYVIAKSDVKKEKWDELITAYEDFLAQ